MNDPQRPPPSPWLGPMVLVGSAVLAYHNSFAVPFLFDDHASIPENPTIRRLWPIWEAFSPPVGNGYTVGGRPFLNFTFALNYAVSGTAVWSYHAFNLLIHVLASLTLLGVLQHSFARLPPVAGRDPRSRWIPLGVALLWLLHPLQTQSVTYIVQRAESLVSLLYLLTFYCFIRGVESARGRGWYVLSMTACLLGMMTKEVMVTAPLLLLLYDRTFVAGSLRAAWHARHRYYLGLFCTWILLAWLIAGTAGRGGSVGSSTAISWPGYALTQCVAIAHYLRLVFWPSPLVFDYGAGVVRSAGDAGVQLLLICALGIGVLLAWWRRPGVGFLGASFFLLLAPSSSFVPITTQTVAEHRMYLALAPVLVLALLAVHRWLGRRTAFGIVALAAGAGWLTVLRNADYQTELSIWRDTVQKRPNNARAQNTHGMNLFDVGRFGEALPAFQKAVQLAPSESADYHFNLALTLDQLNRRPEALPGYLEAVRMRPGDPEFQMKLAVALGQAGRFEEAAPHFETALRLRPAYAEARVRWAVVLHTAGRSAEAISRLEEAVREQPDYWQAWNQLGICFASMGRHAEAIESFKEALRVKPGQGGVLFNLGESWLANRNFTEAAGAFREALRTEPENPKYHQYYGITLAMTGRISEAATEFERALQLRPDYAEAGLALARARAELQRTKTDK